MAPRHLFNTQTILYTEDNSRTLGNVLLAVTTADADTVDDIALLSLVTEAASLVRAGGARSAVDDVQLAVLPAPRTIVRTAVAQRPTLSKRTGHGEGIGGHPTASFCTARRYTCRLPSCGLKWIRSQFRCKIGWHPDAKSPIHPLPVILSANPSNSNLLGFI